MSKQPEQQPLTAAYVTEEMLQQMLDKHQAGMLAEVHAGILQVQTQMTQQIEQERDDRKRDIREVRGDFGRAMNDLGHKLDELTGDVGKIDESLGKLDKLMRGVSYISGKMRGWDGVISSMQEADRTRDKRTVKHEKVTQQLLGKNERVNEEMRDLKFSLYGDASLKDGPESIYTMLLRLQSTSTQTLQLANASQQWINAEQARRTEETKRWQERRQAGVKLVASVAGSKLGVGLLVGIASMLGFLGLSGLGEWIVAILGG